MTGDREELAAFFMQLTGSPDIKICLFDMSRAILQEIYYDCLWLKLQDLTFGDIKHYTSEKCEKSRILRA